MNREYRGEGCDTDESDVGGEGRRGMILKGYIISHFMAGERAYCIDIGRDHEVGQDKLSVRPPNFWMIVFKI